MAIYARLKALETAIDQHLGKYKKSSWREVIESVGVAVLIALALREAMPTWDVSMIFRAASPLTPAAQGLAQALRRTPPRD